MLNERLRLVQVEFFPPRKEDLESTLRDILERTEDNTRAKMVVRFFDRHGLLTDLVRRRRQLDEKISGLMSSYQSSTGIWRIYLNRRASSALRARTRMDARLVAESVHALYGEILLKNVIAIEDTPSEPFRVCDADEHHELIERATHASRVWVFVFQAQDILTDAPGEPLCYAL